MYVYIYKELGSINCLPAQSPEMTHDFHRKTTLALLVSVSTGFLDGPLHPTRSQITLIAAYIHICMRTRMSRPTSHELCLVGFTSRAFMYLHFPLLRREGNPHGILSFIFRRICIYI
jgi:hypothetical protein